jgi:hypothetical protein
MLEDSTKYQELVKDKENKAAEGREDIQTLMDEQKRS